jgi:hypothetical protein
MSKKKKYSFKSKSESEITNFISSDFEKEKRFNRLYSTDFNIIQFENSSRSIIKNNQSFFTYILPSFRFALG